MGKKALSGRENWQTESGPGGLLELRKVIFTLHLKKHLKEPNTSFLIILQILNTYMTMLS